MKAIASGGVRKIRLPSLGVGPQIVAVLLILGLLGAMAVQPTRQLIEQRERIAGMDHDLSKLERANKRLEHRIGRLNDPDYLEQRAREQIGLIRPGETTYVVVPPSRAQEQAKDKPVAETEVPPPPGFFAGFLTFIGL